MQRREFLQGLGATGLGCWGLGHLSAEAEQPKAKAPSIDIEQYRADAVKRWENDIAKLEEKDKTEKHPDSSVLFVGSSSIRRWDNIATDMAPYHAIERGYGGAKWSDVAIFAERLITPHQFQAAVFFVGNDISGKESDKTPQQVVALFANVLATLRKHNPTAPVFYIAVTPTEARFEVWPKIKAANTAVSQFCAKTKDAYFIGTESVYFDANDKPRADLFVDDKLHLNQGGYDRWGAVIKSHLDTVLD
ncbi:MAG: hypothetical protein CMJ78_09280 [Planctomycetaceae bacterium]|nr:hypothetical protein [Planctomycetaceae bacterium]